MGQNDAVTALSAALDQAGALLAKVGPVELDKSTPCEGWTVRELAAHLALGPSRFLQSLQGQEVDWAAPAEVPDDQLVTRFRPGADALIEHWQQASEEELPAADFQTAEFAVHTWDLAQAIDSSHDLDPVVGERALAAMQGALTPENRGDVFASPVEVPDDAPVYDRLAAWAGRDPSA